MAVKKVVSKAEKVSLGKVKSAHVSRIQTAEGWKRSLQRKLKDRKASVKK